MQASPWARPGQRHAPASPGIHTQRTHRKAAGVRQEGSGPGRSRRGRPSRASYTSSARGPACRRMQLRRQMRGPAGLGGGRRVAVARAMAGGGSAERRPRPTARSSRARCRGPEPADACAGWWVCPGAAIAGRCGLARGTYLQAKVELCLRASVGVYVYKTWNSHAQLRQTLREMDHIEDGDRRLSLGIMFKTFHVQNFTREANKKGIGRGVYTWASRGQRGAYTVHQGRLTTRSTCHGAAS